jgi:PAS domain S-box-containing protein
VVDTTERKKVEEEFRFSNAMKMTSEMVVISDIEGKIIDVNDAFLRVRGCDNKKELVGRSSLEYIAPEDRAEMIQVGKAIGEKESFFSFQCHALTKNGSRILIEGSSALMR